jgi:hypothetical protein
VSCYGDTLVAAGVVFACGSSHTAQRIRPKLADANQRSRQAGGAHQA